MEERKQFAQRGSFSLPDLRLLTFRPSTSSFTFHPVGDKWSRPVVTPYRFSTLLLEGQYPGRRVIWVFTRRPTLLPRKTSRFVVGKLDPRMNGDGIDFEKLKANGMSPFRASYKSTQVLGW
jgi:hypothetical protein